MNNDFIKKCEMLLGKENNANNKKEYNLKDICSKEYSEKKLVVPIGKINENENIFMDMTKISGLFISGTTGSGKSVFIDDLIVSLMLKNSSREVQFVFLDPKRIELGEYDGSNYIMGDKKSKSCPSNAYKVLDKVLYQMKQRIDLLILNKKKSITSFNMENKDIWPHIFIFIDEGNYFYNKPNIRNILNEVLAYGKLVGYHLIFATNAYLKDYYESGFIKKFKYCISFDLASVEQAKYVNIEDASWLNAKGEAIIKSYNGKEYRFQTPYVTDKQINTVLLKTK